METYRASSLLRAANPKASQGFNFYLWLPDEWLTPPGLPNPLSPDNRAFSG